MVAELKPNKKNFKEENFISIVEHLKNKVLPNYGIETVCLSLDDM